MTLNEVLEQLRALYVDELTARVNGFSDQLQGALLPEALYCLADGELVRTGPMQLPARGDLCVRRDNQITEVARIDSPRALHFEPFQFLWADALQVALHPFGWDDCALAVPEPIEAINFSPLQAWAETALKVDEPSGQTTQRLSAIHSVSPPRRAPEGTCFEIDLGSASVGEFERLLDALVIARVGLVAVGRVAVSR